MAKRIGLYVAFLCAFVFAVSLSVVYAEPEKAPAGADVEDSDGDGMPNWWEAKYGLNSHLAFDGDLDPDFDKLNNLTEYKTGTEPKNENIDANKDGVADDWMKFYNLTDVNADADGDSVTTKEEYDAGTDPTDKLSSPKKVEVISQKHPDPIFQGIIPNVDNTIPENHEVRPNVFKFMDPIGDDKGPGYYTYPTNPVYAPGGFDLVSFEVDASGPDNVIFKITVNADLKQDWGMSADFDIQTVFIFVDQDGVPGSGEIRGIPGLNVFINPANAWEKAVIVSPQPENRVQIEIDIKAKDMAENILVPQKVSGSGRTITAIVKKKALGIMDSTDLKKWKWQVVMQSNEGYPDPEDVLTRNVNEYKGLHRFGGGNDYWGDPELVDIMVAPAMGTMAEATNQFACMSIWESYSDPRLDIKAVLPMVSGDDKQAWVPEEGYLTFAKNNYPL